MHPAESRRRRYERAAENDRIVAVHIRGAEAGKVIPTPSSHNGIGWWPTDLAGNALSELPYADGVQAELCVVRTLKRDQFNR